LRRPLAAGLPLRGLLADVVAIASRWTKSRFVEHRPFQISRRGAQ
jgi:hypothetical protein